METTTNREVIITNRTEIKDAFEIWHQDCKDNPDLYDEDDRDLETYAGRCADHLIKLLKERG